MAGPANMSAAASSARAPMLKLVEDADAVDPAPADKSRVALVPPSTEAGAGVAVVLPAAGLDTVTRSAEANGPRWGSPVVPEESRRFNAAFCPVGPEGGPRRARTPSPVLAGAGAAGRPGAAGRAGATVVSTIRTAVSRGGVWAATVLVAFPATCSTAGCAGATTWSAVC